MAETNHVATMTDPTQVTAPVFKASVALASGVGTSVLSTVVEKHHFFPTDYAGWAAAIASTMAALYSIHLMADWYWKKVLRDWFARRRRRPRR